MKKNYIKYLIKEAKKAYKKNEVPIGCIIIQNGKIISKSHNMVEHKNTSLAHAEIIAIKKAQKKIKNWRLENVTIYVTLQPCLMCLNAIAQCRIKNIVYYTKSNFLNEKEQKIFDYICKKNKINVTEEKSNKELLYLLQKFFKEKRKTK